MDLFSTSSRLLLRSALDCSTDKRSSLKARVECVRVNPGEQSQCQFQTEGPTTENARVWRVEEREKRTKSTSLVPLIGGNCNLWCPGWDSKDLGSRPEHGSEGTSRPGQRYGIRSGAGKVTNEEIYHLGRNVSNSR